MFQIMQFLSARCAYQCCRLGVQGRLLSSSAGSNQVVVEQTKRRRRRQRMVNDDVPSYKEFVHRFSVLSLYRNCLKAVRAMPHNQDDLKIQVQREFRAHKNDTDPFNIQRALADGQRQYTELLELTGQSNGPEVDSWLNTNDPEDPRGRVGQGWPWDSK